MPATYSTIPELNLLNDFLERCPSLAAIALYGEYGDTSGLKAGGINDPEALSRLIPFAEANASGSEYALWRLDDRSDLATLPVVVFGDEGGKYVVARNLRELFQLVAYDAEIMVHEDAYFVRDDDYEQSLCHEEYVAWLDQQFGLRPADDPNAVIKAAQKELGDRFASWIAPFLPG
jgi:hypothetical protein